MPKDRSGRPAVRFEGAFPAFKIHGLVVRFVPEDLLINRFEDHVEVSVYDAFSPDIAGRRIAYLYMTFCGMKMNCVLCFQAAFHLLDDVSFCIDDRDLIFGGVIAIDTDYKLVLVDVIYVAVFVVQYDIVVVVHNAVHLVSVKAVERRTSVCLERLDP